MSKKTQSLILGVMCIILTIGISVQIRTVNSNGTTVSSNQKLNELKSQVLKMKEKYEISYKRLENAQNQLEQTRTSVTKNDEELKNLEEKIKNGNILIGTRGVTGSGVIITVKDATVNTTNPLIDPYMLIVHDIDILSIINELKNAGAEAIDVNGQRIVNSTEISCDGNVITVNNEKVGSPFVISAIGMKERFNNLKRNGGYLERMSQDQINVDFKLSDKITIPKYTGVNTFKYAKTVE